jgi:hypothetical protein
MCENLNNEEDDIIINDDIEDIYEEPKPNLLIEATKINNNKNIIDNFSIEKNSLIMIIKKIIKIIKKIKIINI